MNARSGKNRIMNPPRRTTFSVLSTFLLMLSGVFGAMLMLARPSVAAPFQFQETGSMAVPHDGHTATLLNDGKVLVAAGENYTETAELYDPVTGTWTATADMIVKRRFSHSATLLRNGKVLVVGGLLAEDITAELYDPVSGTWTLAGDTAHLRWGHTATLLADGKVLVAGGGERGTTIPTAELYDPASGAWTNTGDLIAEHTGHTATLLSNGDVLVAGSNG